jgi:hypothetical protein
VTQTFLYLLIPRPFKIRLCEKYNPNRPRDNNSNDDNNNNGSIERNWASAGKLNLT